MDITLDRQLHISFPDINDAKYNDITTGIESGSASLSEIIFSSGNIQFGTYSSNKFEVRLFGISNVSGEKIIAWFEDSYGDKTKLFTGYVDSCKLDNLGYDRQIVAYDSLYWKKDTDVSQWWYDFWENHQSETLSTIRKSVCDFIGLNYDTSKSYFNDSLNISKKESNVDNLSFSQILTFICELQCLFPNIDRDGNIEFISLDPDKVITHSIVGEYEQLSSEFEEYQINPIDRIVVELGNEVAYRTVSTGFSQYTISDNILIQDFTTEQIKSFADAYLVEASKIQYIPASVKMIVSDLSIHVGDIVTTSKGSVYVLDNEYSGSLLVEQTISATGDKYLSEISNNYSVSYGNMSKKISDLSSEVQLNYVKTDSLDAKVASIGYLKTVNLDSEASKIGYLKTTTADAKYATVETLESDYAHITDGIIDNATIDVANVDNLYANYAHITDGVIDNASVGNAQIIDVSANKLTTGTIDASKITVTNLNADNITVGTINGQRIGNGSLSLNKLAEDVYTEAEIDSKLSTMQAEIDGTIETFTGTTMPTLNNYPASSWKDDKTKAKHVGDIFYIVNDNGEKNGYCYRFAYDNTENVYKWILIQDTDITAALSRIDDLETFESNTSSWISNTDIELTSIKSNFTTLSGKVSDVEDSLSTKVESSTFNEVKQTVDSNTTNITALSTKVDTKADNSTVTTLSNTVNSVKQTVDSNSSVISNITKSVGTNSDGTISGDSLTTRISSVTQDLGGFKTTVSATYSLKSDTIMSVTPLHYATSVYIGKQKFEVEVTPSFDDDGEVIAYNLIEINVKNDETGDITSYEYELNGDQYAGMHNITQGISKFNAPYSSAVSYYDLKLSFYDVSGGDSNYNGYLLKYNCFSAFGLGETCEILCNIDSMTTHTYQDIIYNDGVGIAVITEAVTVANVELNIGDIVIGLPSVGGSYTRTMAQAQTWLQNNVLSFVGVSNQYDDDSQPTIDITLPEVYTITSRVAYRETNGTTTTTSYRDNYCVVFVTDACPPKPTTEVTENEPINDTWTKAVPLYDTERPYRWLCIQYELCDGSFSWSDIAFDQETTGQIQESAKQNTVTENLAERLIVTETSFDAKANSIESIVQNNYNTLDGKINTISTQVSQTVSDILLDFTDTVNDVKKTFTFSEDGLDISVNNSNIYSHQGNDEYAFKNRETGETVMRIDTDGMTSLQNRTTGQLEVGAGTVDAFTEQWAIRKGQAVGTNKYNLDFVWIGG